MKKDQLIKQLRGGFIGTIVLAGLSIYFIDHQLLSAFSNQYYQEHFWQFFRTMTDLGLGEIYFAIAIFGYLLTKFIFKQYVHFRQWAGKYFICLMTSGFTLQLFKHIIGRQRPLETVDFNPLIFQPLNTSHYFHSMPSGHSQVIFCSAMMFSVLLPKWKWLWFSFALFVAFTRVATQQHWLSDTFVGAYIGWAVTNATLYWLGNRQQVNS